MRISKERMRLVDSDAESIFGAATTVGGDYSLVGFLRAIIINRTEWTIESVEKQSAVLMYKVSTDEDAQTIFGANSYPFVICETRNGYFPSEFTCEGWKALDGAPHPINRYLSQFTKTRMFVNEEKQRLIVFVERQAR